MSYFSTSPLFRDGYDISIDDNKGKVTCVSQYWTNGANVREYKPGDKQFDTKLREAFVASSRKNTEEGKKLKESVTEPGQKLIMGLGLADYITELVHINM